MRLVALTDLKLLLLLLLLLMLLRWWLRELLRLHWGRRCKLLRLQHRSWWCELLGLDRVRRCEHTGVSVRFNHTHVHRLLLRTRLGWLHWHRWSHTLILAEVHGLATLWRLCERREINNKLLIVIAAFLSTLLHRSDSRVGLNGQWRLT